MTKEQLHALAEAGVAQKLAALEQELASYHKEWPHLFLSHTPPQLLRAPAKNGNGHRLPTMRIRPPAEVAKATRTSTGRLRNGDQTREKRTTRERTARLLALIGEKGPMTTQAINAAFGTENSIIGPLVHHGYLKRVGDDYQRTAKAYTIEWRTYKKKKKAR